MNTIPMAAPQIKPHTAETLKQTILEEAKIFKHDTMGSAYNSIVLTRKSALPPGLLKAFLIARNETSGISLPDGNAYSLRVLVIGPAGRGEVGALEALLEALRVKAYNALENRALMDVKE